MRDELSHWTRNAGPVRQEEPALMRVLRPLQQKVKDQGLWAHLEPGVGRPGFRQVKLAFMLNEIVGPFLLKAPSVSVPRPDSGNAEIIAMFGTEEQKARYLQPLLGEISSCYSMTEPTRRVGSRTVHHDRGAGRRRLGDQRREVVLLQRRYASFYIVMAVTNP